MSKLPEVFPFTFDPETSDIPALKDDVGRVLWTCIKWSHITDQYYSDKIMAVVERIKRERPERYCEFKKIIESSPLNVFGRFSLTIGFETISEPDQLFWTTVWGLVKAPCRLKVEVKI